MEKILDLGDEYRIKATKKKVGNFTVVAIGWEHPNYGYFADAMVWVRSMHMGDWKLVPVINWSKEYEGVEDFLEDYPKFSEFFEYKPTRELLKSMFPTQESLERMFESYEYGDDWRDMVP